MQRVDLDETKPISVTGTIGNAVGDSGNYIETHLTFVPKAVRAFQFKLAVQGQESAQPGSLACLAPIPGQVASDAMASAWLRTANAADPHAGTLASLGAINLSRAPASIVTYCHTIAPSNTDIVANFRINVNGNACVGIKDFELLTSDCPPGSTMTEFSLSAADADKVFAWGERSYSQVFSPAGQVSQSLPGYRYRSYSGGHYLGVNDSSTPLLYYFGPLSGNTLLDLGSLSGWLTQVGP